MSNFCTAFSSIKYILMINYFEYDSAGTGIFKSEHKISWFLSISKLVKSWLASVSMLWSMQSQVPRQHQTCLPSAGSNLKRDPMEKVVIESFFGKRKWKKSFRGSQIFINLQLCNLLRKSIGLNKRTMLLKIYAVIMYFYQMHIS